MVKVRKSSVKAIEHLKKDRIMRRLIERHGILKWTNKRNLFKDLVESVIAQQLSGKAADTITERFRKLFGSRRFPSSKKVAETPVSRMRRCGLSRAKAQYIQSIAKAFVNKTFKSRTLYALADEEAIKELIKLRGVGRWTAEMILMFTFQRPDVFSVGDLGLCTAVSRLYGVRRDDSEAILKIAKRWKPYRSAASRYLWRSLGEKK